ncbi:hypothetical protein [Caldimonas sp.]|uniref:hypothetical protein n=1 Tax=Caldimonas sp. TaxID=2838790 RepID=UPI00391894D3
MTSQRKRKLHIPAPKPRNPLVAPAQQRKAGAHRKGRSAERQHSRQALRRGLDREG